MTSAVIAALRHHNGYAPPLWLFLFCALLMRPFLFLP